MNIKEPSVIQGLISGKPYGVMGAGAGERVSNITPLGNAQQQRMAGIHEQAIAQALGGVQNFAKGGKLEPGESGPSYTGSYAVSAPTGPGGLVDYGGYGEPVQGWGAQPPEGFMEPPQFDPSAWERQFVADNAQFGFPDRNRNGIPDSEELEEEVTRPDGSRFKRKRRRAFDNQPQQPPIPNVYAQGGSIMSSPMQNPMVLELMARGIRNRARKVLPSGLI